MTLRLSLKTGGVFVSGKLCLSFLGLIEATWHAHQLSIFQILLTSVLLQTRVDGWFKIVRRIPQSSSTDYRESCQLMVREARGNTKQKSRSRSSYILHCVIGSDGSLA